ncbi:MAG: SURF1 family protein [Pseudomonadota bacterium]
MQIARYFNPGWKMTLFFVFFLPLLLSLGLWQMSRAAEKNALETQYLDSLTALPIDLVSVSQAQGLSPFTRVRMRGQFTEQTFLLDNQIEDGQPGYWVIQAFDSDSGQRYLLNRGYLAAPGLRTEMPLVSVPEGALTLVGAIWPYTGLLPVWDGDPWSDDWPRRIQQLNINRMAAQVQAVALEIRLEPGQAGVLRAAPFAAVLGDEKHLGYAATWFGLAVVLLIGYLIFGLTAARASAD